MPGETQSGMQCAEFEGLISEGLDGTLSGPVLERFRAHRQSCAVCGPIFSEAEAGLHWLKGVPEVEPPPHLVQRILASTTGLEVPARAAAPAKPSLVDTLRDHVAGLLTPVWGTVRQPRFAMSFAMAFFSISAVLNISGVKLSSVTAADLRPSALRDAAVRTYYETTARAVRYYDNLRLVYEIESRVRELRKSAPAEEEGKPQEQPKEEKKNKNDNNDTSGQPEKKQEQYSNLENGLVAGLKTSNEGAS